MSASAAVAEHDATYRFDLPPMELSAALRQVALITGTNLLAPDDLLKDRRSPAVSGELTAEQAVATLLGGSGLHYRLSGDALIVTSEEPKPESAADRAQPEHEPIFVTGSHVRGAPPAAPVIVIGREQIDRAAPASAEELMRKLPQNLSAGVGQENFGVTGAGADITDHGAGINLRGLGQRATLVLVNGRRVAPSGSGSFVDVSLIPVSAIERVEVLTDGASAIYGSDAVGGVVNFILRKDLDGIIPTVQVGGTTEGGGRQLLAGLAAGHKWSSGRALLSYEYRSDRPVTAAERDFTINLPADWYLFPRETRHSIYGTARQQLAAGITLDLSASWAARDTERSFINATLIPIAADATARSYGGEGALQMELGQGWLAEASAAYYKSKNRERQEQGGLLFNHFDSTNSFSELAAKADGPLLELPGGPVKLALGGSSRREHFSSLFETRVNLPNPQTGARTVYALYGELNLPAFTSRNGRPGFEQLVLTAAGRFEHYEAIGSSFNPKLGALWSPAKGVALRGSFGTSFRAPLLSESLGLYNAFLFPAAILYTNPAQAPAGVGVALIGANPDVRPERSRSLTAGVELAPPTIAGLKLGATFYKIRFRNRIALPTNQVAVIGDPALAPIVTLDPAVALTSGLLAGAGQVLDVSGPGFTNGGATPADVVAIVDARFSNTAVTRTSGLDFLWSYDFAAGDDRFGLTLNANHVFRFDDKLTTTSPWIATLNTPYHAVKWRARGGLSWSRGPLSAAGFVNFTSAYRDNRTALTHRVGSFTTLDAQLALDGSQTQAPALRKARVALTVQNLLGTDPPLLRPDPGSTRGVGYDPVNATGRGRTISLQLRQSW